MTGVFGSRQQWHREPRAESQSLSLTSPTHGPDSFESWIQPSYWSVPSDTKVAKQCRGVVMAAGQAAAVACYHLFSEEPMHPLEERLIRDRESKEWSSRSQRRPDRGGQLRAASNRHGYLLSSTRFFVTSERFRAVELVMTQSRLDVMSVLRARSRAAASGRRLLHGVLHISYVVRS